MKEIRIDSINNDVVIFAKNRSKRPMDRVKNYIEEEAINEYEKYCPFCRGNESYIDEETFKIEDQNGWIVKSVYNKFPIVNCMNDEAYGVHEVMIETNRHNGNFYNMSINEFENMLKMYKDRYKNLMKDTKIEYISIFKNFLRKAGASLQHPHSQIISLPMVPPDIEREIFVAKEYYETNNKCLYSDIIENEIKLKKRIVHNEEDFLILIPFATRYNGEVRIIFKKKIKFEELEDKSIKKLAEIFNKLFKRLYDIQGYTAFNLYIHTHPINIDIRNYFNVHIHIIPRRFNFGGFELGNGMYVSSTNPEELSNKLKFY